MPAKSRAQFRFMAMLANNPEKMKNKPEDLSSEQAKEFIDATPSFKSLPETTKSPKFDKLKKYLKG